MSKQADHLRWEVEHRKKDYYVSEEGFLDALERTIDDVDKYMMELPLDADDVPIRVGDVMRCALGDYEYEVLGVGEQCFFAWNTDGGRLAQIDARGFIHRKRTLEDVLRDFLSDMADASEGDPKRMREAEDAAIAKAADEIRGGMMGRDEMTLVLRRMVDTLPDVETDICTEINRAVDEIAGRMW